MKTQLWTALARTSLGAIAIATAMPALAHAADETAQGTPQSLPATPTQAAEEDKDIVVTGTQVRGITPAGQTVLATTKEQAEEQAVVNGNELLMNLPTATNMFQQLPGMVGGQAGSVAVSRLPTQGVSLRNLPNVNTNGSPTLVLIDGHRVVPTGTNVLGGQQVDNGSIAAGAALRTEVMPDGASSIYGSDAVTGVINYVTRDDFDGIEARARYGIAPTDAGGDYIQYDFGLTAGMRWDSGAAYVAGTYSYHDALFGRNQAFSATVDRNPFSPLFNTVTGLNCDAPNIQITSDIDPTAAVLNSRRLYPLTAINGTIQALTTNAGTNGSGSTTSTNGVAGGNRCNNADFSANYPEEKRYNAAFGITQDLMEGLTFRLKGHYSRRETQTYTALTFSPTLASTSSIYRPVCTATAVAGQPQCGVTPGFFLGDHNLTQTILTNLTASPLGPNASSFVQMEYWQITPSLTWDFAGEWQARAFVSYGESDTLGIQSTFQTTTAQARVTAGTINPYNIPGSAAGAFDGLITYGAQNGKFDLLNAKLVADGPLPFLTMPGGPIRAALGTEYLSTTLHQRATATVQSLTPSNFTYVNPVDGSANTLNYKQTVKAAFAELQVPLIGPENDFPLIRAFNVSGSARYDKYNDFGDTFNYAVGTTIELGSAVRLRGNYNTSFAAPTNFQQLGLVTGAQINNSNCNGPSGSLCNAAGNARLPYFAGFIPAGGATGGQAGTAGLTNAQIVALGLTNSTRPTGIALSITNGTIPGLGPQTSKNWSVGADFTPPFIPGLSFGGSYYNLTLENAIASPFAPAVQSAFDQHPEVIYCHGGVIGNQTGAQAACAVPMSMAELAPYFTPITSGGLALPSSLTTIGLGSGSGSNLPWSSVIANYCGPSGATNTGGTFNPADTVTLGCAPGSYSIFYVADNRVTNLGNVYVTGVDFRASYRTNVPWGTADLNVSGNVNLSTEGENPIGSPRTNLQQFGSSNLRVSASAGTTWGGLRGQLTWQHSQGWTINPTGVGTTGTASVPGTGAFGQTRVGSFNTFDTFFRYRFDEGGADGGWLSGLQLTLNINNIFDTAPPRSGGGRANGQTIGRTFIFGLTQLFK